MCKVAFRAKALTNIKEKQGEWKWSTEELRSNYSHPTIHIIFLEPRWRTAWWNKLKQDYTWLSGEKTIRSHITSKRKSFPFYHSWQQNKQSLIQNCWRCVDAAQLVQNAVNRSGLVTYRASGNKWCKVKPLSDPSEPHHSENRTFKRSHRPIVMTKLSGVLSHKVWPEPKGS